MAYTPVPTKAAGDSGYTADNINSWIRDNLAAGVPDLMTTKGDMAVATGSDAAARVAAGVNNSYLYADSAQAAGVLWAIPALVKVNDPNAQTYLHATGSPHNSTKLTELDNEFYDTAGAFASDRFTAPHPGIFLVTCFFQFRKGDYSGGSDRFFAAGEQSQIRLYKNGSLYSIISAYVYQSAGLGSGIGLGITHPFVGVDIVQLNTNDYIEFYFYCDALLNVGSPSTAHSQINPGADDTVHHASITLLPM